MASSDQPRCDCAPTARNDCRLFVTGRAPTQRAGACYGLGAVIAAANSAGSTLPPESTSAAVRPSSASLPASTAAKSNRAARLDDQLQVAERERDRAPHLVVAHGETACQEPPVDLERQFARGRQQQRIADRRGARRVGDPLAGRERAPGIVQTVRLDRVDRDAGKRAGQGERAAGDQAAAAARHQRHFEIEAARLGLLDDLQPRRALPGDDARVIVGPDQRRAGARRDLGADRLARLARAVVQPHLGAVRPGVLDLDRRRVGRHHDGRAPCQELRRRGHALGVIAGGVGDHGGRVDLADRVVGAAKLERAGALQAFGLQQHAPAGPLVQRLGFEQRRAHGDAAQPCRGGLNVGEVRQAIGHFHWPLIAGLREEAKGRSEQAALDDNLPAVRDRPRDSCGRRSCPASAIDQARALTTPVPEWRSTLNWP